MANMCNNTINFIGPEENIIALMKVFNKQLEINDHNAAYNFLLLPDSSRNNIMYSLEILNEDTIYFETKWDTNYEIIPKIASLFELSLVHEFEMIDQSLYGLYKYTYNSKIEYAALTKEEIEMCKENGIENWEMLDEMLHSKELTVIKIYE